MENVHIVMARKYDVIEWIPFDRLSGVKKISKGGFGSVYSATWLDGVRKVETIKDADNDNYKKVREPSSIVALKTLAGLSRKTDEKVLEGDIYGVMPYVAPEVLLGEQQFTQAADVYGLGVIMTEITTGQRAFDGRKFDAILGADICGKGLRPEFALGTPKCYIELAEKCMNSDPKE
ncbi:hypothetical protein C2G38_2048985 [Gigaspora rosea]|uniref:Protein kinase domain-containing protein n=1 Tax=Gigaspora rosea TaxID=44941 RepID=A0A397U0S7_9GLOM|nr:hypothetical protein C2G38_2048985 [Gigaspora rosea]